MIPVERPPLVEALAPTEALLVRLARPVPLPPGLVGLVGECWCCVANAADEEDEEEEADAADEAEEAEDEEDEEDEGEMVSEVGGAPSPSMASGGSGVRCRVRASSHAKSDTTSLCPSIVARGKLGRCTFQTFGKKERKKERKAERKKGGKKERRKERWASQCVEVRCQVADVKYVKCEECHI